MGRAKPWSDPEQWKAMPLRKRFVIVLPFLLAAGLSLALSIGSLTNSAPPPPTYCVQDSTVAPAVSELADNIGAEAQTARCYAVTSTSAGP